ncbi:hypothetical protein M5X04_14550 [Paenibacillus alvei]|uniref:Uncharacterized protein n=1 Tax=Paenibacillus alvei TaxID=44250 RepID=A0ABT4E9X8_PAEAL|nr:hypothetical protein [Paenibacillus alvei]MCY9530539.1 hypothetical protein [Paenibacillus alvei]
MTIQQRASIERAIEEYMPLYDRYLFEPDPTIRQKLKAEMQAIESKYGIQGEWF